MLSRKQFKDVMAIIQFVDDRITKDAQLLHELIEDYEGVPKSLANTMDLLLNFVETSMQDDTELIQWWVFDSNFGAVPIEHPGGEDIGSLDDLYNALKLKEVVIDD